MPPIDRGEELRAKLNAETGKITWRELERHFARGVVIRVAEDLDLVEVAYRMAKDDRPAVERWLTEGRWSGRRRRMRRTGTGAIRCSGRWWWRPGCWCRNSGGITSPDGSWR